MGYDISEEANIKKVHAEILNVFEDAAGQGVSQYHVTDDDKRIWILHQYDEKTLAITCVFIDAFTIDNEIRWGYKFILEDEGPIAYDCPYFLFKEIENVPPRTAESATWRAEVQSTSASQEKNVMKFLHSQYRQLGGKDDGRKFRFKIMKFFKIDFSSPAGSTEWEKYVGDKVEADLYKRVIPSPDSLQ